MGTTGSPGIGHFGLLYAAVVMGSALLAYALGGYGNAVAGARPRVGRACGLAAIGMSVVTALLLAIPIIAWGGSSLSKNAGVWAVRAGLTLGPIASGIGVCLRAAGGLRDDDQIAG